MSSGLNSFLFSTAEMTRVFSAGQQLRAMASFEWALMSSLESCGLAEAGSGTLIESLLEVDFVDMDSLQREARDAGNIAIPFVRQLSAALRARDEGASRIVHMGATSQDVLDTTLVLQMREAVALLDTAIQRMDDALVKQVIEHRQTMLMGRTWLQPGPPTTLGLKLAGTLSALRRHRERISSAASRACVLQFGGAVGTLAALGGAGEAVSAEIARILNLPEPESPWHTQRDGLVEMVQVLAGLTGSLAKLARDIALLMQVEIAEVSEARDDARGASSTMPHKHNPVGCAAIIAIHSRMPGLVTTMLCAMPQEHERGLGSWQAEWETVPDAFCLAAAALMYSIDVVENLEVDAARMRANFDALMGLTLAEAVSLALAKKIGRASAQALLRDAAGRAMNEERLLSEVLKEDPAVTTHLTGVEIDRLLEPGAYLGSSDRFIANVLGEANAGD